MNSYYDDSLERQPKHLMPIEGYSLMPIIREHASTSIYKLKPIDIVNDSKRKASDITYNSNNGIWEDLLNEKLRRTDVNIILDSFFIFEWFPRSPGLYFTYEGRKARSEARDRILTIENNVVVYNPYGKMSMLEGGIGNLRLKPIKLETDDYYFVSASSNGNCHEGVPVAIPSNLFNEVIDEIADRGAVVRNLVGRLRIMPDNFSGIYLRYNGVPKLYLQVYELSLPSHPKSRSMEELSVSVASSFISSFEGHEKIYATYATFDPAIRGSLRETALWMDETYVTGKYMGNILTDFDEVMGRFKNAPFSLSNVMNLSLQENKLKKLHLGRGVIEELIEFQKNVKIELNVEHFHMEQNKYKITGGQIGALGDGAHAHDFTQQQIVEAELDLDKLIEELTKLRVEAKKEAVNDDHEIELGKLAEAASAAKKGDKKTALEKLAVVGKWTYGIAEKIGTTLVAGYLKSHLGM